MRKLLGWLVRIVVGIVVLVVVALGALGIKVNGELGRKHVVPDAALAVPEDSAAIARGAHLTVILQCQGCHGHDLSGTTIFDVAPMARVHAPNLTTGGVTKDYTPADWVRAVRHGVGGDGRNLLVMPSTELSRLSDADLGAIVAYVRSLPPSKKASPSCELRPLGWVLATVTPGGIIAANRIDHAAVVPSTVPPGVTAEYGDYLADACRGCHGAALSGAQSGEPGAPPAPNLTPAPDGHLRNWTQEQFVTAIRTGVTPEGKALSGYMPWTSFRQMTDDELAALWMYLHGLPAHASTAPKAG